MIIDYLKYVITNIMHRKLRSWLTMLGIFVGIAAVVALISLSQGMQDAINDQFAKIGTSRILITPGGIAFGPFSAGLTTTRLTEDDVNVVKRTPGIEYAFGAITTYANVDFNGETVNVPIIGMPTDSEADKFTEKLDPIGLAEGRRVRPGEQYSAVIGYDIAKKAFSRKINIGNQIMIGSTKFTVVGILNKASGAGAASGNMVRISKDVAKTIFGEQQNIKNNEISSIFSIAQSGFNVADVADTVKKNLRRFRDVKKGEEDFTVTTTQQIIKTVNGVLGVLTVFLTGVAGISLFVGGIGIMNTMYTAVLERRREIGVMKSIGARNSDVLQIFLIESGLLGVAGGIIGIIIGFSIAKSVQFVLASMAITLAPTFQPGLIFGALIFSFLVGSIAGTFPAMQASRLHPVDALRR